MAERPLYARRIQELVDRQLGHVTRRQLLDLGFSRQRVDHRIATGELIAVHRGVYALGHVPHHAHARAMAAVLACGEDAALSHAAALALWEVADWPATLELTSPRHHERPGLIVHRSRTLTPRELRRRHGVAVTSPVRTVLDVASRLTDARLVRVVNDLRVDGHLRATAFAELCERSRRIERLLGDRALTRSELEDRFRRFITRHRLPMPETDVYLRIAGRRREVDAVYRDARLIIELDSWSRHGDRAAFERDRAKDTAALADGWRTVRITAERLRTGGDAEAATIRRLLAGA